MAIVTAIGTGGIFVRGPVAAVAVYYLYAVLRPQYIWEWALPQGIGWSQIVALAALAGTLAHVLGISPFRPDDEPDFKGVSTSNKLIYGFGVCLLLSYLGAINQAVAGHWLTEYAKIFLVFTLGTLVVRRVSQFWVLYLVAAGALIYIAYEVNSLYLLDGRLDIYKKGYGGLDNNGAALMLAMGFPLALYGFEGSKSKWRWALVGSLPIILHAVLLTYSRGAMLSLIVASPLMVMRSRKRKQFAVVAVALLCAVPVLAGQEIRDRFLTLGEYEEDETANQRFDSWAAGFAIANDYPLFGAGIRNSNLLSFAYGADMEGRTIHSQYLQLLADCGYPALFLYLGAIVSMMLAAEKARRAAMKRDDDESKLAVSMLNGIQSSTLVFAIGSTFLSLEVFELPYLLLLIGGQLAVVVRSAPAAAGAAAPALASAADVPPLMPALHPFAASQRTTR